MHLIQLIASVVFKQSRMQLFDIKDIKATNKYLK